MNAKELFEKHAVFTDRFGVDRLDLEQFTAALSEAMRCGHLQPVVMQSGDVGKGGTSANVLCPNCKKEISEINCHSPNEIFYFCQSCNLGWWSNKTLLVEVA